MDIASESRNPERTRRILSREGTIKSTRSRHESKHDSEGTEWEPGTTIAHPGRYIGEAYVARMPVMFEFVIQLHDRMTKI
jgi:hypothetical protein